MKIKRKPQTKLLLSEFVRRIKNTFQEITITTKNRKKYMELKG